ncbi:alpha/beta hydrolase [Nonomuraea sp. FMUSA5-5]|uniref:Alpha/beta hydrolase n=1 Tax=Nonomuraea composti TaxID=2720023 RepID=A0ABX1BN48_9ACTN|nr:alpha/beta hydrolase [Nonomuraea sp. FMUSA5-5]NJP96681.1 alpha/beta hydrolase [Nonomuraea sp. FMUSA5-5]
MSQGEIRQVRANAIDFAYLERGAGPLVLFLHGFPDNAFTWTWQLERFAAAGYRAVAPFLRGYAPSGAPADGAYDPRTLGEDVAALIDGLSPDGRAHVVGMDWGGTATHAALLTHPARIRAAVVLNTAHPYTVLSGVKDPELVQRLFHFWFFQSDSADWAVPVEGLPMVDYLWRTWSPNLRDPDHVAGVKRTLAAPGGIKNALAYYRALWRAQRERTVPVGATEVPTLSLFGETDFTTRYAAEEAPGFSGPYERRILPALGHFPHREAPETVTGLMLDWFARHPG